ncbi:hypothetical protein OKA04_10120 [Luteolibacter flavescens]|uniref:SRPBCC family protein n=1 Tax=Luteolibacter flavescens TaxID=1859460 RepID=A0ABT3FND0_9BACT|nr:hypothetical protein [Luteolibacter flavescens]MCW1885083.1 hypothetical protein [Luteolibacter flavescens]
MNSATITIDRRDLRPYESVSGQVRWELEKDPRELELRLCWFTRGRGTEESRTIQVLSLGDTRRGERAFSFPLPAEPWSTNGTLIRITWALEVVARKVGALGVEEFTVSPQRREIVLREVPDARSIGRAGRWAKRLGFRKVRTHEGR